jgi:hypothetical protein
MNERKLRWGLALGLGGCAGASQGEAPAPEPELTEASASPVSVRTGEGVAAADPTPEPVAAEPAPWSLPRLSVVAEGHGALGGSLVDGELFVFQNGAVVSRVGPRGGVAERLAPPDPDVDAANIEDVGGHWPAPLMARGGTGYRDSWQPAILVRDDHWRLPRVAKGRQFAAAWAWHSRSILAVTDEDELAPRLAVVMGAPKAPRIADITEATPCQVASIDRVAVAESGPVAAIVGCGAGNSSWYVAAWNRRDLVGAPFRLTGADDTRRLDIDDEGRAIVATSSRTGGTAWMSDGTDAAWTEIAMPAGDLRDVAMGRDGVAWAVLGGEVYRLEAGTWAATQAPGEGPITHMTGARGGTPWIVRNSREIYVRDPEGAWHEVVVPAPAFFPDLKLEVMQLSVSGSEAVVTAEYFVRRPGRTAATRRSAVLSTRAVEGPLRFGGYLGRDALPLGPWPRGAHADCKTPMSLLMAFEDWRARDYKSFRRKIRGKIDVGSPRFVELEIGPAKMFAAIVESPAAASKLVDAARRVNKWAFPEVVCGDQVDLDWAGVKIHAEVGIDVASGELVASDPG